MESIKLSTKILALVILVSTVGFTAFRFWREVKNRKKRLWMISTFIVSAVATSLIKLPAFPEDYFQDLRVYDYYFFMPLAFGANPAFLIELAVAISAHLCFSAWIALGIGAIVSSLSTANKSVDTTPTSAPR